jgi:hypothetical protein
MSVTSRSSISWKFRSPRKYEKSLSLARLHRVIVKLFLKIADQLRNPFLGEIIDRLTKQSAGLSKPVLYYRARVRSQGHWGKR